MLGNGRGEFSRELAQRRDSVKGEAGPMEPDPLLPPRGCEFGGVAGRFLEEARSGHTRVLHLNSAGSSVTSSQCHWEMLFGAHSHL